MPDTVMSDDTDSAGKVMGAAAMFITVMATSSDKDGRLKLEYAPVVMDTERDGSVISAACSPVLLWAVKLIASLGRVVSETAPENDLAVIEGSVRENCPISGMTGTDRSSLVDPTGVDERGLNPKLMGA